MECEVAVKTNDRGLGSPQPHGLSPGGRCKTPIPTCAGSARGFADPKTQTLRRQPGQGGGTGTIRSAWGYFNGEFLRGIAYSLCPDGSSGRGCKCLCRT